MSELIIKLTDQTRRDNVSLKQKMSKKDRKHVLLPEVRTLTFQMEQRFRSVINRSFNITETIINENWIVVVSLRNFNTYFEPLSNRDVR